ncbi:MAG: phosphatidylglycerol lysyltransferase domain-containing protein [Candidatus Paraimprobicoccus trichonymphae]|uniref:Phosphatidylglycerol lysyltransferase domain-containing protein n=1 Tax=Candidatus Paraimprobicoccus trichonymphae TaxID=3033793 RepID=A0AA48HW98_9FIRM|nr:MAG: phosphatidylglycerol lysyltransferase domain-containing protein [Candidatus Paraimprobicoccus trichonymphae]
MLSINDNEIFKSFEPLALKTKQIYDYYVNFLPCMPISDNSFQSLYAWNSNFKSFYKIIYDHLCIFTFDKFSNKIYALPPIGNLGKKFFSKIVDSIYLDFKRNNLKCVFCNVPKFMLPIFEGLYGYSFSVEYDRNSSDYLYTKKNFIKGLKNFHSRKAISCFEKNPNLICRKMDENDINKVIYITKKFYCSRHKCKDCYDSCEIKIESSLMLAFKKLELLGNIIESHIEPLGFQIFYFQNDIVFFISRKICRKINGITKKMDLEIIKNFETKFLYANYTEDLGIPGLRFQKEKIGRYILCNKYTIKLKKLECKI